MAIETRVLCLGAVPGVILGVLLFQMTNANNLRFVIGAICLALCSGKLCRSSKSMPYTEARFQNIGAWDLALWRDLRALSATLVDLPRLFISSRNVPIKPNIRQPQ